MSVWTYDKNIYWIWIVCLLIQKSRKAEKQKRSLSRCRFISSIKLSLGFHPVLPLLQFHFSICSHRTCLRFTSNMCWVRRLLPVWMKKSAAFLSRHAWQIYSVLCLCSMQCFDGMSKAVNGLQRLKGSLEVSFWMLCTAEMLSLCWTPIVLLFLQKCKRKGQRITSQQHCFHGRLPN